MDFIWEAKEGNLEIHEDDPLKQKGSRYAFPREWYTCNLKTDRGSATLLMTDVAAGVTGFELRVFVITLLQGTIVVILGFVLFI